MNVYASNDGLWKWDADGNRTQPIASGFYDPRGITVDQQDNLYLAHFDESLPGGRIDRFAPGSTTGTDVLAYDGTNRLLEWIAIANSGDIFAADVEASPGFSEWAPNSNHPFWQVSDYNAGPMATDSFGNLYTGTVEQVSMYTPGSSTNVGVAAGPGSTGRTST